MPPFLAFGHSHIVALAKGFGNMGQNGSDISMNSPCGSFHYLYSAEFVPNLTTEAKLPTLHPTISSELSRCEHHFVILSLGGNEHNVLSILQLYQKYDFILAEQPQLPLIPEAEIYPEAMVRETLRDWMAEALDLLRAFRRGSRAPMAQIAPPPPLPKAHVLAHPGDLLPDPGVREKVSPDSLRYKMWRVACSLYRETCKEAGIGYIEVPPDVIDARGMLADPYLGGDATHANEAFGRRMMAEAFSRLNGVTA
jgi:hypothetical protein